MTGVARFCEILGAAWRVALLLGKVDGNSVTYSAVGPSLVKELDALGPTFIKLAQMLSLRPDIIPSELADELRKMLDHGSPIAPDAVQHIIKTDLGNAAKNIFTSFEEKPFAVASLAQVHKAVYEGRTLAIKVQKPNVRQVIKSDLAIVRKVEVLLSLNKRLRALRPVARAAITEFERWIERELDYRLEALSMERINKNFGHVKYFGAPAVEPKLSSQHVLAMEYIDGVSLNEIFDNVSDLERAEYIEYKDIKFKKKKFMDDAIRLVFKQIFEDGLFHADPHPGNIFLTADDRIIFVDFGIVGVLQPHFKALILEMFIGIIERDVQKITTALIKLDEVKGHAPVEEIEGKVRALLDDFQTGSILEMTTAGLFFRFVLIALECKVDPPYSLIIMGKAMLEYDGDLRKLEPQFDIIQAFRELLEKRHGSGIMGIPDRDPVHVVSEIIEALPVSFQSLVKGLRTEGVNLSIQFGPVKKGKHLIPKITLTN